MSPYEDPETLKVEAEHLRGLLREVANSDFYQPQFNTDDDVEVSIPADLWNKILPLRTVKPVERTAYEMTDAATATGMYDHDDGG